MRALHAISLSPGEHFTGYWDTVENQVFAFHLVESGALTDRFCTDQYEALRDVTEASANRECG